METNYRKEIPLLKVEGVPVVGKLYHVSWGYSHGIVGRCIAVSEQFQEVKLQTPKTKKSFAKPVKWSDLRHTRAEQFRIEQAKLKNL